jgi:hypothetical protein
LGKGRNWKYSQISCHAARAYLFLAIYEYTIWHLFNAVLFTERKNNEAEPDTKKDTEEKGGKMDFLNKKIGPATGSIYRG